jgi:Transposase DDE domain
MFQDMISTAICQEIPFAYVLADTWFASVDNFIFLKETKQKDFIIPLKDNHNVAISEADRKAGNWVKLDSLVFEADTPFVLYLESLPFPLAVYRAVFINSDKPEGILYLSSSDLTLTGSRMTTIYQSRWKVEEYHKSFKGNACFSSSPTKLSLTQKNHFFCSLVAYIKLEWFRMCSGSNHFALKSRLYMSGLRASHADWQSLRSSIVMPRLC